MAAHYRHLVVEDRVEIQRLHDNGVRDAEIARQLGVHRSTIGRELRRESWQPEHDHAHLRPYLRNRLDTRGPRGRLYLGGQAQLQANTRADRSHQPFRMRYDRLVDWVIKQLQKGWTPEEIGGRLPVEFPDNTGMRTSAETLYAWVYAPAQKHRQLWQYLARGHKKRRRRSGRKVQSERIKWGTRFLHAAKLPGPTAQATMDAQIGFYQVLPAHAAASVTADNGSEFAFHYQLADTLGIPTYFADPYSAWQRGTNEHFNGRIRKYLPKGTSFAELHQTELDEFVTGINNRPRKILG